VSNNTLVTVIKNCVDRDSTAFVDDFHPHISLSLLQLHELYSVV